MIVFILISLYKYEHVDDTHLAKCCSCINKHMHNQESPTSYHFLNIIFLFMNSMSWKVPFLFAVLILLYNPKTFRQERGIKNITEKFKNLDEMRVLWLHSLLRISHGRKYATKQWAASTMAGAVRSFPDSSYGANNLFTLEWTIAVSERPESLSSERQVAHICTN